MRACPRGPCLGTGAHGHTTHIAQTARIHYRFHPLYDCEVEVVVQFPRISPGVVLIVLPDQSRCALPEWMLDPIACAGLVDRPEPMISPAALCRLRELLDAQEVLPPHGPDATTRDVSQHPGGGDVEHTVTDASADDGLHRRRTLGADSGEEPTGVPSTSDPAAQRGRSRRRNRGGKE